MLSLRQAIEPMVSSSNSPPSQTDVEVEMTEVSFRRRTLSATTAVAFENAKPLDRFGTEEMGGMLEYDEASEYQEWWEDEREETGLTDTEACGWR